MSKLSTAYIFLCSCYFMHFGPGLGKKKVCYKNWDQQRVCVCVHIWYNKNYNCIFFSVQWYVMLMFCILLYKMQSSVHPCLFCVVDYLSGQGRLWYVFFKILFCVNMRLYRYTEKAFTSADVVCWFFFLSTAAVAVRSGCCCCH